MEKEKLVALVKGVQKGDDDALTQMYESFHDDLYYYIFKTVNDPELAADLTQDTFIEILQSIGSLQEPAAFVTWSRQIAYRRCTAYFKKRHDLLVDEDEDGYSVFDTIAEDRAEFIPDEALDKEDLKQTIHSILNDLPEEQRAAIMMRYFDELSVADIAKIQGVSEGTVKSRLNYGRKAIKESVETYEKKNNIKLHCVGIVPLLLWLLREYRLENGLSLTTGGAAANVASASAATAATVASATVAAKTVGAALAAKIAAVVLTASAVVGGVILGGELLSQTEPTEETCQHQWQYEEEKGICSECSAVCEHTGFLLADVQQAAEGVEVTSERCKQCSWHRQRYSLTPTKDPIHITMPTPLVAESVTELSHAKMLELLKDTWKLTNDPTVTVTCIGTLYFYNEEWVENSGYNNRLVFVYHLDNGIIPGGWYTYLGPNGSVCIKYVEEENGQSFYTTVAASEFYFDTYMSYLWIECMKEYYSFWLDTNYPVSFVYNDIRYMGHQTIEDCLVALEENSFKEWELKFDHMIASGQMRDYVSDY